MKLHAGMEFLASFISWVFSRSILWRPLPLPPILPAPPPPLYFQTLILWIWIYTFQALITFNKTKFFLWNPKNTHTNGVNKLSTHTRNIQRKVILERVSMKKSDTPPVPVTLTNPLSPYFMNPSLLMGKIWTPFPFCKSFKNANPLIPRSSHPTPIPL